MQFAGMIKRFLQFLFDPDVYCLAWLSIRNQFKKSHAFPTPAPAGLAGEGAGQEEKAQAKAAKAIL